MKNLWFKFDDYIHSIYFEKEYRDYYMRGGNLRYSVNLPLLFLWGIVILILKLIKEK